MNALLDLQDKLMTNGAAIGRLEVALAHEPASVSIHANLRSFRKLHQSLTSEFHEVAKHLGLEVCSYKMLEDRPTARALSRALGAFQDAFSTVFESLRSGPMPRRHLPKDTLQVTDLHIAYAFPGSFGVMMTVSRDMLLFPDWPTRSDEAIDIVFGVARSRSSKEVAQVAHQIGRAPIAAMYEWAKGNAQNKTGASVEWSRDTASRKDIVLQYPEFAELSASIEETSEDRVDVFEYRGSLVGADTKTRRFHFVTEDDMDIRGRFTDAISENQKAKLPAKYSAKIEVKTKVNFAKAEEEVAYDLLALVPSE